MKHSLLFVTLVGIVNLSKASEYPFALPCDYQSCELPDCRCTSEDTPQGLSANKIPQIVSLSFDDGMNVVNYEIYKDLLFDRVNPNGCPITSTFFLTHLYTDYSLVHDMWTRRHDIASHSISHNVTTHYWLNATKEIWENEIVGMRQITAINANLPGDSIIGMRAPFLDMGGNAMYEMLYENGFAYDNSWPTKQSTHLWPYTLDYASKQKCEVYPCPATKPNVSLPGLWVIPMIDLYGDNGFPCAMMDACIVEHTVEGVYNMLLKNFDEHYYGDRGHFGLYQHSAWFQYPGHKEGLIKFLDYIQTLEDVYIVSLANFLSWAKDPTPLDRIEEFEPWRESCAPFTNNCKKINCHYSGENIVQASDLYMTTCLDTCPDEYPWVNNVEGSSIGN